MSRPAKSAAPTKPETVYQPGESVTIWRSRGIRDDQPTEILSVTRCNQREVELSDGQTFKVNSGWIKPTQPSDAVQIERNAQRAAIGNIDRDELDLQAVGELAPFVKAWRGRVARRALAVLAAIRSALIDGPRSDSDLGAIISRLGVPYDARESYIRRAGGGEAPGSRQHGQIFQRISTDEDRFNAIIMGALLKKTKVTMDALLDAVIAVRGGSKDELETEVVMALGRCGAVMVKGPAMGRAAKWQLQPFDKPGS